MTRNSVTKFIRLSEVQHSDFPDEWYELTHEDHFWFKWRLKAFLRQIKDLTISTSQPLHGLDIGCGTGILRRQLERSTAWSIDGADLNANCLSQNKTMRGRTFLYDIHDRHKSFKSHYEFIILFDVLEHIENEKAFLESVLYHLKPRGWLFVNVPAMDLLMSEYDRVVGHLRRYNKKTVSARLNSLYMDIKDIRYWGASNLPLLLFRKLWLGIHPRDPKGTIEIGFKPMTNWVNSLLSMPMHVETTLITKPALGSSLLAAATKPEE